MTPAAGASLRAASCLFLLIDFLIYFDRGILPGLHEEVVEELLKSKRYRARPELSFGVLQSTFIAGLAISAPMLSHFSIKHDNVVRFVAAGLVVWIASLYGCMITGTYHLTDWLFFFRGLSGVGEAAFASLLAPALVDAQPAKSRGIFLGCFYALMPLGVSCGYIVSSFLPHYVGLSFPAAFALLGLISTPPVCAAIFISFTSDAQGLQPWRRPPMTELTTPGPTVIDTRSTLFKWYDDVSRGLFACILMAGASQAAVTATLSAFGTSLLLALGIFTTELRASVAMGTVAVMVGAIGTLSGGVLCQVALNTIHAKEAANAEAVAAHLEPFMSQHASDVSSSGTEAESQIIAVVETPVVNPLKVDPHGHGTTENKIARSCCTIIALFGLIGSGISMVAPLLLHMNHMYSAMATLAAGLMVVCMVQSSLNLGIMNSSRSPELKSFSLSLYTLGIHIFGDVPGPIVVGMLKDRYAPGCAVSPFSARCVAERGSLIVIVAFLLSWTTFIWLGGFMGAMSSRRAHLLVS